MKLFLSIVGLFIVVAFSAQLNQDSTTYRDAWSFNRNGAWSLTAWSTLNIGSSISLRNNFSGSANYLNQMNGLWNVVNLGLGAMGLVKSYRMLSDENYYNTSKQLDKLRKIYQINFYIDFAYISSGLIGTLTSDNFNNSNQVKGYSQSIIVQGAFLLIFDYVMYKGIKKRLTF